MMEQNLPAIHHIVRRRQDILSTELDGSLVLMSIEHGHYVGVTATGRRIWELLDPPRMLSQIIDCLASEFEADGDELTADVVDFVGKLKEHGLVDYQ